MYKGNKTVLPRILSLILATGLTLSGVPVGVMAAETTDAAVQQETVQEAEEPAAPEEEEEESASSEQEEEESVSTEQEEEQETPQEEATTQDEDKAETAEEQEPEEEKDVEKAPAPAKAGTVEDAAEDVENSNGSDDAAVGTVIEKTPESENVRDASANEVIPDGLYTEDGYTYYYENGSYVTERIVEIDGSFYYFDYNGWMVKNETISVYDNDSEDWFYYHAREDGSLIIDGWYQDGENRHYFDEKGHQVRDGLAMINGALYYFDWYGNVYCDQDFSIYDYDTYEEYYYHAREDGSLVTDDWYQNGENWQYYDENGHQVRNGIAMINGILYGFDWYGNLLCDDQLSIYDEDSETDLYYRTKSDGSLYVNEWYSDEWGDRYYYGEGGVAPRGLFEVDGILYLFSDWGGYLLRNDSYESGDDYYISDNEGVAHLLENGTGWIEIDGSWYYYKDKERVTHQIIKIEDKYYGFDYDGRMYAGELFEFYDSDSGDWFYYCASEDGSLIIGDWYQDEEGWQYFDEKGRQVRDKVVKINDSLYGFDWRGRMYDGEIFDLYDDDSGNWIYYRARLGGKLYAGEWYDEYGEWYYYDSDAKGADGPKTIKNITYVFEDARMLTNTTWSDGNAVYIIDANGVAKKITGTGWIEANGDWFYSKNGTILKNCVEKIGDFYYGFNYSGRMYSDSSFYKNGYRYRAKPDGTLYVNSWVQRGRYWYYYGAEGKGADGLVTLGGKTYLFDDAEMLTDTTRTINGVTYAADSNGIAKKLANGWSNVGDEWYYLENNTPYRDNVYLINNKYYGFDGNGRMYNNEKFSIYDYNDDNETYYRAQVGGELYVNSWVLDCSWYYYGAAGKALTGKQKVGGKDYYFDSDGEMLANCYVNCDGKVYQAAANGVLSEVKNADLARMIFNRNAATVAGGASLRSAWKQYGGKWYYFDEDGIAVRGHHYINGAYYYFDDDNVMQTGWIHNGDGVMYADSNGKLVSGEKKLDGKWYYFTDSGWMQTGIVYYNDKVYLCGKDGVYIKTLNQNGWVENSGTWYYLEDGNIVTNQQIKTGGHTYYFDYSGHMVKNALCYGQIYDANGYQVTLGWYKLGSEWYYVKDGYCVNGDQTINGKKYYFIDYRMFIGEREVDGELQTYDASGALTKTVKLSSKNGWTLFGGDYYYYANGKPYTGWVGNYYVSRGIMQTDRVIDGYYLNELGVWVKTQGWVDHNNKYVKANGKVAMNEWLQIGGSWYYFDSDGDIYRDDYYTIGTKQYAFDSSGKWIATADNLKDETKWVSAGGKWYYISKGHFANGEKTIDGKVYYFVDGEMSTNALHYNDKKGGYVWYGADGTMANLTGWNRVNGKWYWFNQDSTVPTGWVKVNGKSYYIYQYGGMATGVKTINDKVYQFDSSGALVKQLDKQNGWFQSGSDWYYFKDGEMLSEGIHVIDNVEYGFSGGKLAANEIVGTLYYYSDGEYYVDSDCKYFFVDGSGKVSHSTGWKKVYGTWYYFGTNGIMLTGIQNINGTMYNFGYDYDYDYYYD